jgi:hypothetical protein
MLKKFKVVKIFEIFKMIKIFKIFEIFKLFKIIKMFKIFEIFKIIKIFKILNLTLKFKNNTKFGIPVLENPPFPTFRPGSVHSRGRSKSGANPVTRRRT